jgi:molybdopterin converting factor small subunit
LKDKLRPILVFGRGFCDYKDAMLITVRFTSLFRTLAGVEQEVLEVAEGVTIGRLAGILLQKYPDLPLLSEKTYFVINDQVTTRDQVLAEGDEVRAFQLLAGG